MSNRAFFVVIAMVVMPIILSVMWLDVPEHRKDRIKSLFDSTIERACFESIRDRLNDPETAYLIRDNDLRNENLNRRPDVYGERKIKIDIRAKNAFGAYIVQRFQCTAVGKEIK
ncbi:hypothetical protein ACIX9V_000037 [Vibrio vulnificus]|uniref:hypothetical protein n=1 Tax=Vibrio vulnificus TaxID=672 RepID=UPI00102AA333|nr:hypothetical protein [Vibrio vulnificus]RZR41647.1 hypothetical protein D8T58_20910 [Vibrio vulnificus]